MRYLAYFDVSSTYLYRMVFVFLVSFFLTYLYLSYWDINYFVDTRSLKKAVARFYHDGLTGNPKDLYYYLDVDKEKLIFDENTVYIKR